jgi:hypothetical protein
MIKLQQDERPTYVLNYPRRVRWTKSGTIILLVGIALVRWVLAWGRFLLPVIQALVEQADAAQILLAQPLRPLISAHVSLLLVSGAVALVYHVLPDLALVDRGLAMRTLFGWRAIPWSAVKVVRIAQFEDSQRRLVLVQGDWVRWSPWPRLVSMCLGAGFEPGLVFSTDIRDFKPFVRRLYDEVNRASPGALFDPDFFSLPARLVMEPVPSLDILVEQALSEGWPLSLSAQAMSATAAGLVLVQILLLVLEGGAWWMPLLVVALCEVEWLIGAFYLFALVELFPAQVEFQEAALLYPLPQVPRALLTIPMAMLVAAGAHFVAAILGLLGVLWAVLLTALLVQRLYNLKSLLPALVGGAFQALYQFIVLAIVFGR